MRLKVCMMFALAALFATSAFAGDKCTYETQACLNHMAADQGTKGWLGIDKEKSAEGYKVTKVIAGGPAEKAGIKVGDLVTALNGMTIGSEQLKASYSQFSKAGSTVKYTVVRDGKNMEIPVTLAKMPEDAFAQMVGNHMLEHSVVQSAAK